MTDLSLRRRMERIGWLSPGAQIILAPGAVALGLVLARLPLLWAAISLLTVILLLLMLVDPLVGLGAALALGLTKPLTDAYVPALPLDLGQIVLIAALGAWALHAARRHTIHVPASPFTLPLLIFIGAASLSLLNALSLGYALKELIKWAQLLVVMWLVIDLAGKRRWQVVVGVVLSVAIVEALIGVWQFALRGEGPEHFLILGGRFYRAYGTFEQPNPYGGFLGLALPIAIGLTLGALGLWVRPVWDAIRAWRPVQARRLIRSALNRYTWPLLGFAVLSLLLATALLMSWSRGAWLGAGAAMLAILFAWPRRVRVGILLVLGSVLLGAIALHFNLLPSAVASRLTDFSEFVQAFDVRGMDITPANYAVLERLAHWQAAQEMARYHLWLGVGFGNYEPVYPAYSLINWPHALGHAHNYYLNLLAETGIIGLIAYCILWGSILWQTWRLTRRDDIWQRSLAVGLLGTWVHLSAHQFFDKLYVANIHLHLGALLGVLSILILLQRENQTSIERDN